MSSIRGAGVIDQHVASFGRTSLTYAQVNNVFHHYKARNYYQPSLGVRILTIYGCGGRKSPHGCQWVTAVQRLLSDTLGDTTFR